jgi:transposase
MSMGKKRPRQPSLFVPHTATRSPGHRFYEKLDQLLKQDDFDRFVEELCQPFYAEEGKGRPSIPPGVYFRMLLIGYFEGIESERGIAWRCGDSLSLRSFLGLELTDAVPDHSSLSRIRKRLDLSVFEEVFRFVLRIVESYGLLKGKVVGVDSTYLRADASMKAIVRRDTGEAYGDYLLALAAEVGIEEPTAEDARRLDKKRPKKTSNADWESATDPDARIARLKDGRTRLAYKPEHVTDLETGAILSATVHLANEGDTKTVEKSLESARENVESTMDDDDDDDGSAAARWRSAAEEEGAPIDVVGDKGYHKAALLVDLEQAGFRPYIAEPKVRGGRRWTDKPAEQKRAVRNARRRASRAKAKQYHRRRGEHLERTFAHICETGQHRRTRLRGLENMTKRYVLHAAAANLGLVLRTLLAWGTPRGLADAARRAVFALLRSLNLHGVYRVQLCWWRDGWLTLSALGSESSTLPASLGQSPCWAASSTGS